MTLLRPCGECARHVRAADARCPFCAAPMASAPDARAPRSRLGRAALFAFRTTTAAALIGLPACGDETDGQTVVPVYGGPPVQEDTIAQPYGAPPDPEPPPPPPEPPPATDPASDPGAAVPAYGAPPPSE